MLIINKLSDEYLVIDSDSVTLESGLRAKDTLYLIFRYLRSRRLDPFVVVTSTC